MKLMGALIMIDKHRNNISIDTQGNGNPMSDVIHISIEVIYREISIRKQGLHR